MSSHISQPLSTLPFTANTGNSWVYGDNVWFAWESAHIGSRWVWDVLHLLPPGPSHSCFHRNLSDWQLSWQNHIASESEWQGRIMAQLKTLKIETEERWICNTIGSILFFMAIISAAHKPVQSGLLKPTELAQTGGHCSSHWVCKRGQNTCRNITPIIQSVSQKAWPEKQNRGKGEWNG